MLMTKRVVRSDFLVPQRKQLPLVYQNALDEPIVTISHRDPNNPGKAFLIQIDEARLVDAYTALRGGGASLEIGTLIISIPPESVQDATLSEVIRQRKGEHTPHWNKVSNVFQIDFVMMDTGAPEVVTIDRILDRSAFSPIETGPFNVRVILTEEPRMGTASGLTTDMIQVDGGGSATAVVAGLTIDGGVDADDARTQGDLTLGMIGTYYIAAADDADDTDAVAITDTGTVAGGQYTHCYWSGQRVLHLFRDDYAECGCER